MTAEQLSTMLSKLGDNEVVIKLNIPSIGETPCAKITGIEIGTDYKVYLTTDAKLIDKNMVL